MSDQSLQARAQAIIDQTARVVLGKEDVIRQALCTALANGHLLLEDLPGVGKTTLAHALAISLGLRFRRLQFTADMLPSDVLGVSIFERSQTPDQDSPGFRFHPGPIFTEVLLADEINRAPPKVQSALLEAMEERQVTIEGKRYALPQAFFVIATQNPVHQHGTYPLPESQLDRFAMVVSVGYPETGDERALLAGEGGRAHLDDIEPMIDAGTLQAMRAEVEKLHLGDRVLDYVQQLLAASRRDASFGFGLSPRAGLMLIRLARAWAYIDQRQHVLPDDVQAVLPGLANHRLPLVTALDRSPAEQLLSTVPVP